ncbi:hypothetical protein J1N35_036560 [Gossypium stocksii]|uniref:Uncharacterized protein n=1 Tax=Gossypium stocksii TaxID=47602 RepID=A0A9D3UII0_9ROSI|nr:hypothetical protein J1N35_036560 [Gossypium stocksii]
MVNYLAAWGIWLPNFAYHFDIVNGERRLSDSSKGFILPLYILEAGFHLLLHHFFYTGLEEYRIAAGQLTGLSCVCQGCEPVLKNWTANLCLNCNKFILVRSKLSSGFDFPTKWSILKESICHQFQPLYTEIAVKKVERLSPKCTLELKKLLSVRNIFRYCLEGRSPNGWQATDLYLGFKGESSGRPLTENVIDPSIDTVEPTHPSVPSQPSQLRVMDVEAQMESVVEAVDARIHASSSSSILELPTKSANAADPFVPISAPLSASLDLSTTHQTSHTPRKQDRELSHDLKEFTYPSPFSILVVEDGLVSWALQKACAAKEAKWAEFERTILFDEQSLNQLRQSYSAKITTSQSSSPRRRPNTSPWRPEQGS